MTGAEALALAKTRGVTIRLDGTELELIADRKPDSNLLDAIAGCKAEIIALLHPDAVRRRLEAEAEVLRAPRPPDVIDAHWAAAQRGLRAFIAAGYGEEAERLGWPRDELYAVPPLWSRGDLCGAALVIGDREVIGITSNEIRIRTSSGAPLAFYRKPAIDYALIFRERLKMVGDDGLKEEPRLRSLEAVINLYRANHPGVDVDTAKAAVLAAIDAAVKTKETA
jgi:hypothetical protein